MASGTRAQASVEYLIILSIVIVIALVVVGAMGGLPRLGGSTSSRTSSAYWQQADIGISASFLNASNARLVVKNNQNFRIRITSSSLKDPDGNVIYSYSSPVLLKAGKSQEIPLVNGTSVTASGDFNYDVFFTYMDADNGLGPYQFTGEQGLVGRFQ